MEISVNLSFNNHIQNLWTSARRSIGSIKRTIRTNSPAIRKMACKTLVHAIIDYSSSVLSPCTQSNIPRIEIFHRRAVRWTLDNYSRQTSVIRHVDPSRLAFSATEKKWLIPGFVYFIRSFVDYCSIAIQMERCFSAIALNLKCEFHI